MALDASMRRYADATWTGDSGSGTIYLARQTGIDANGKLADGFRAQAVQVMENIKTALASVGAGFEHVVKLTRLQGRSSSPCSRQEAHARPPRCREWCRRREIVGNRPLSEKVMTTAS